MKGFGVPLERRDALGHLVTQRSSYCYFEQGMAGTEARLESVELGEGSEKWTLTIWITL